MVFGEIVEPSTRALMIEDEDLDDCSNHKPEYELSGNFVPPDNLDVLIFVETVKPWKVISPLVSDINVIAEIKWQNKSFLRIHQIKNKYVVVYSGAKDKDDISLGEVVEILAPWISKAKQIEAITTEMIKDLQPSENYRDIITVTKCLTNNERVPSNFCERLEIPNMVGGLGATVLSYCVNNKIKCNLWVIYTDFMPPDSINCAGIINLFKMLGFDINVEFQPPPTSIFMYM